MDDGPPDRLLRVVSPSFVAGAIYSKDGPTWRCVLAAPILRRWVMGRSPAEVRTTLEAKGWGWTWH